MPHGSHTKTRYGCYSLQIIARPLQIPPSDLPGRARQSPRHMNHQYTPFGCAEFLDWNAVMQPVIQARLGATRLGEGCCTNDTARPPVSYPENDFATAFVGERDTVVHQLFKVVVLLRLLELEVTAFGRFEPLAQLFVGGWHGSYPYNSPRKARC
jgi:hypothetical protein